MATLKKREKLYVVGQLAMFRGVMEVVAGLKEEFGTEASRQQVASYDAGNPAMRPRMSQEHVSFFEQVRERYKVAIQDVPIALSRFRLEKYQDLLEEQLRRPTKSAKTILQILEQAAKESGGAYTNRHELSGPDGGAIPIESKPDLSRLSKSDVEALLAMSETVYAAGCDSKV